MPDSTPIRSDLGQMPRQHCDEQDR